MKSLLTIGFLLMTTSAFSMLVQDIYTIQELNIEKAMNSEAEGDFKRETCFELGRLAETGIILSHSVNLQPDAGRRTKKYAAKLSRKSHDRFNFCSAAIITIARPFTKAALGNLVERDGKLKAKLLADQIFNAAARLEVIEQALKIKAEISFMPRYDSANQEVKIPIKWKPEICFRTGKIAQATEILQIVARENGSPHQSDLGSLKTATEEIESHVCHGVWDLEEYNSERKKMSEAIDYFLAK